MSNLDDRVRGARERLDSDVDIETPAFGSVQATARRRRAMRYGAAGTFVAVSIAAIAFGVLVARPESHSTVKIDPTATSTTVAPTTTTVPVTTAPVVVTSTTVHVDTTPVPVVLPQVEDCKGVGLQTKPSQLILACGDGGIRVVDMSWDVWTGDGATGSGRVGINTCKPDCATGGRDYYPVTVELTNVQVINGAQLFATLNISFTNASPIGMPTVSCPMAAGSQMGGCVEGFYPSQAVCDEQSMLPVVKAAVDTDYIHIQSLVVHKCISGFADVEALGPLCGDIGCYNPISVIMKDDGGGAWRVVDQGAATNICAASLPQDGRDACDALGIGPPPG